MNCMYDDEGFYFLQDRTPPHYATKVRSHLNKSLIGKWIKREGAIDWPARSPDLTPMNFFCLCKKSNTMEIDNDKLLCRDMCTTLISYLGIADSNNISIILVSISVS